MKINMKEEDELIERLGKITHSIKSIYEKFGTSDECQEYLDIALEVEDGIYEKVKKCKDFDQFIRRANYIINLSNLEDKEDIIMRIVGYISQRVYLNPFRPLDTNFNEYFQEMAAGIENQVILDYLKAQIIAIDEELKKDISCDDKDKLIKRRNELLFQNKILEYFVRDKKYLKIDGKERCLAFNNNEKLVETLYMEYISNTLNNTIQEMLSNNSILNQVNLKSILSFLSDEEKQKVKVEFIVLTNYTPLKFFTHDNPNIDKILEIIDDSINENKNSKYNTHKK